jgi:hypothetical protein
MVKVLSRRLLFACTVCVLVGPSWAATSPAPAAAASTAAPPAAIAAPAASSAPDPALAAIPGAADHWPMLKQYCSKCHNAEDWAGSVAFDTMAPGAIADDADIWEHAVSKLRGRLMPPPGNPQPPTPELKSFVSWMESTLDNANGARPANPGFVALHRLNRKEYANAVSDLVGLKIDASGMLPQDDIGDGFDNVANVLQVSPSFLDNYIAAARLVATEAMGDPAAKPVGLQFTAKSGDNQQNHVEGLPLGTRGGLSVEADFPADGEYELNIGNLAAALWVYNMEFQHTLVATLDGAKFFETKIGGEEDMKAIDQKQDPAVDAINARLKKIRFKATAGPHKVAVAFIHRTYAESDDKLVQPTMGGGQDRVLRLGSFEVRGPFSPTGVSDTVSRQKIFLCRPHAPAEEDPCAEQIIAKLAREAYRRPITTADMQPLLKFYHAGRKEKDFDTGIRMALTAILASPNFLYRAEPTPTTASEGSSYRVNDLELASRLSFFLWSSLPDDELVNLATGGHLHEPAVLAQQVKRMLADPRSISLSTNFAFQWLNINKLSEIEPDPKMFPYAGDPRDDYRTEMRLFLDSVFREDHSVLDLMTANYTFLNERLALLYGITDVKGSRFRRVTLTDQNRFGLLGKGAVLMASSYPNRTAPVLRGAWILERITGTPPHAPPASVPSLKENKAGEHAHTVRELMAQHRDNPSCFACHGVLDPLGESLENFDAVGMWRVKDRFAGSVIDASGKLPDGTDINGPVDLRKALMRDQDQFVQTLAEKLMTYATGRTIESYDMPMIRQIVRNTAHDGYRFSALVMNIINSDAFQMRRVPKMDTVQAPIQSANR